MTSKLIARLVAGATGLLAATALATPALAQEPSAPAPGAPPPHRFEVGAFARNGWFSDNYRLDTDLGAGARLDWSMRPRLELEGAASYIPTSLTGTGEKVTQVGTRGQVLYGLPVKRATVLVGGGLVYDHYGDQVGGHDFGPTGLVGARMGLGERFAVRLDGTLDYLTSTNDQLTNESKAWQPGLQLGMNARL
jgi:hypothetical protein